MAIGQIPGSTRTRRVLRDRERKPQSPPAQPDRGQRQGTEERRDQASGEGMIDERV